jgi:hypothetical protein
MVLEGYKRKRRKLAIRYIEKYKIAWKFVGLADNNS